MHNKSTVEFAMAGYRANRRSVIAVAVALALGTTDCGSTPPHAPGAFTPTGSLSTARSGHTATLLASGKVLVAGGSGLPSGPYAFASAELYDPVTGTFTITGSMGTERVGHTATLLPSGRVLIAGGIGSGKCSAGVCYFASAELYDPATGTFTATGRMGEGREGHTAILLPSGKVLIAGGTTAMPLYPVVASAELYDPGTGTFTDTGSMGEARAGHTETLLPNGKVLVAGGYSVSSSWSSAELYDPAAGTFTDTAGMGTWRSSHTATLLPAGKVLIAGGKTFITTTFHRTHSLRARSCTTRPRGRSGRPVAWARRGLATRRRCCPAGRCLSPEGWVRTAVSS